MNGKLRYATVTREGYVYVWSVGGDPRKNDSWWHYRHDERNTGLYGMDTRRPAAIATLKVRKVRHTLKLTFTAPGDDFMVGRAAQYIVRWSRRPLTDANFRRRGHLLKRVARPAPGGTKQTVTLRGLPLGRVYLAIRAVDDAGNPSALSPVVRAGH